MKKTLFLSAILGAALCSSAFASPMTTDTSVVNGTTYNGGVYTLSSTGNISAATITADVTSESGDIAVGSSTAWNTFASNQANTYTHGHTLHLTQSGTFTSNFSPFTFGGLIVDAVSDPVTVGRPGNTSVEITGPQAVNMDIKGNTTIVGNWGINVSKGGTWNVAEGKSLALSSTGAVTIGENANIALTGGTLNINAANVNLGNGANLQLGGGSTVNLTGAVASQYTGGTTTERTRAEGNGFGSYVGSTTIATGTGTLNADAVTSWSINGYSGASYDNDTHTISYDGNSDTYWFYSATGEGSSITDAAGASKIIVDTQDADNAIAMGGAAHTLSSLTIESGVVTTAHSDGDGFVKNGDVVIKGGATLRVVGEHDAFGYTAGVCTKSVTLAGTADAVATLEFNQTTSNSVTMRTNVIMNGNAAIKGDKGFNTFGCSVAVNGTNNLIDRLDLREDVTVNVASGAELTIGRTTLNDAGNHKLTLAGRGTTTVNAASTFAEVMFTGGSLVLKADATMSNLTTANGSANSSVTIEEGATLNISGDLNNSWGIKTLTVDGTVNTDNFIVSTGGMVNTIAGKGTINANSLKSANQTTKAAFSGVTLNLGDGGITTDTSKPIEFGDMTVGVREGSEGWSASVNHISLADATNGTVFTPGENQTITISGNMSGAGKLVKSGEGTLVLSGNNTYAGGTTVTEGTLSVTGANALKNDVTISGGTLSVETDVTLATLTQNGGTIVVADGSTLTVTTLSIAETATLAVQGAMDFTAPQNITHNSITLDGTTITLGADHSGVLTTSALTVNSDSTINGNLVFAENSVLTFNEGTVTLGCTIDFGTGTTIALGTAYNEDLTNTGMTLLFKDVDADGGLINGLDNVVVTGAFVPGHLVAVQNAETGKYDIYATPEPATATLSLLALAGLMARRKRH